MIAVTRKQEYYFDIQKAPTRQKYNPCLLSQGAENSVASLQDRFVFITFCGYFFPSQMVSFGNNEEVVISRDI